MENNGKILPSVIEMEKSVLGSILLFPNYLEQVAEFLVPNDFYKDSHVTIFSAIIKLQEKAENTDLLNVTHHLRNNGNLENIGGSFYLSELTDYSTYDFLNKARIIKQTSILRNVIYLSNEIQKKAYEATEDPFSLVSFAVDSLSNLTAFIQRNEVFSLKSAIKEIITKIDLQEKGLLKESVFKSCISFMDFYSGAVAVIAAKPGSGKTALMLSSAKAQAKNGNKVGILSIEMNEILIASRIIQEETRVSGKKMLTFKLDEQTKQKVYNNTFYDLPIYINPCHELTDKTLYSTISMMIRKYGCEIIYIDYLQLMESENMRDTELQRNTNIMKTCTKASKYFNIPIVVLCQMSRGEITMDNLDEKLRGGGIEQGASQIFGIDYTDISEQKKQWQEQSLDLRGIFKIINSKDRNESPFGEKQFYFNQPKQVIEDLKEMFEEKKEQSEINNDIF